MELTLPMWWRFLNARSEARALTRSWQSSNTPSMAMLWMLSSIRLNIWARWKALIRPAGDSMKTRSRWRPRMAYSAALPVSPEVAPTMLSQRSCLSSVYSKSRPSSCMAMSLKASVGPLDRCCTSSEPRSALAASSSVSGVMARVPKVSAV